MSTGSACSVDDSDSLNGSLGLRGCVLGMLGFARTAGGTLRGEGSSHFFEVDGNCRPTGLILGPSDLNVGSVTEPD